MRYLFLVCLWLLPALIYAEDVGDASEMSGEMAGEMPGEMAGEAPGKVASAYTLAQAFRDALARDARVQASESRIAEARERLEEVKSNRRPTVSVSGNTGYAHNRNEARVTSIYEGHSTRNKVKVSQNLYTFGRVKGRLRRGEAEIAEAEYAAGEVRQEVLAEVAQSFSEQLFQGRILEQQRAFEQSLIELEASARRRIALGTLDRTELYEVLRRLHRVRAGRIRADSHYRVAQARLARLTGVARNDLAITSLAALEAATPATLEDALARGERKSPILAQARQRLEAAEGELAFRKAELWPTLSVQVDASIGKVGPINTRDIGGGVNLDMPLYEGGLKRSKLRSARWAVETARRELTAERERIEIDVRSNWDLLIGLTMALRELKEAIIDVQEMVELTRSKLDAGRATFVQHIEARQSALDAEFDLLDNHLNLEATRIDLLRTLADLAP